MSVRSIASLVVSLCLAVSANASSIGVFSDAAGTSCNFNVRPFTPFTIYIIAILGGDAAAGGIYGAECRVTNIDPAWLNMVFTNPNACDLGFAFDVVSGGSICLTTCLTSGSIVLWTINSLALSTPSPRTLSVVARNPPSPPMFPCPLVVECDANYTLFCVRGGEAFMNRIDVPPCTVSVEAKSWSSVKQLFQD